MRASTREGDGKVPQQLFLISRLSSRAWMNPGEPTSGHPRETAEGPPSAPSRAGRGLCVLDLPHQYLVVIHVGADLWVSRSGGSSSGRRRSGFLANPRHQGGREGRFFWKSGRRSRGRKPPGGKRTWRSLALRSRTCSSIPRSRAGFHRLQVFRRQIEKSLAEKRRAVRSFSSGPGGR